MSVFSKVTGISNKDIKNTVKGAGKIVGTAAKTVAPIASMVPGLGPLASAALSAGGNVLQGHNLASTLKSGATALIPGALSKAASMAAPAINSLGGGTLGQIAKGVLGGLTGGGGGATPTIPGLPPGVVIGPNGPQVPGSSSAGGGLPFPTTSTGPYNPGSSGTTASVPSAPQSGSRYGVIGDVARSVLSGGKPLTLGNIGGAVKAGAGAVGNAVGSAIDYAKDNPSGILAAASAASGALDQAKASELRSQALKDVRGSYDERGALRSKAMAGLTSGARPDLSAAFADPGNVYARSSSPSVSQAPPGSLAHAAQAAMGQRTPSSDPLVAGALASAPPSNMTAVRRGMFAQDMVDPSVLPKKFLPRRVA
jgi:hypothetical protein